MKHFLAIENSCWADEIDLEGFALYKGEKIEDVYEQIADNLEKSYCKSNNEHTYPIEIYVGTNEAIDVNGRSEIHENIKVQEITEEEYNTLVRLFSLTRFIRNNGKVVREYLGKFGNTAILNH